MKAYGFVYETTNKINGMKYIGKCIYGRQNSWESYLGSGTYLKRAIAKYGKENFVKVILEEAYSDEELNALEESYIERFNAVESDQYYNLKLTAIGGDVFSNHPEKERLREMKRKQMSGKGNHQYGKPKTEKMINAVKEKNSRAIEIDGIRYKSTSEASKELGIGITTIAYRLDSEGYPEYKRMTPKLDRPKINKSTANNKRVLFNGVEYPSIKEAAKASNLSLRTFRLRLKDDRYPEYQLI